MLVVYSDVRVASVPRHGSEYEEVNDNDARTNDVDLTVCGHGLSPLGWVHPLQRLPSRSPGRVPV